MYALIALAFWGNKARQEAKLSADSKSEQAVFSAFSAHQSSKGSGHLVRHTASKQTVIARAEASDLSHLR